MLNLPLLGMTVVHLTWISIDCGRLGSSLDTSLTTASITLYMAVNVVATLMIGYKLWYVPVGGIRGIQWASGSP